MLWLSAATHRTQRDRKLGSYERGSVEYLTDFVILGTTIACSFGAAFVVQKAALGLILWAMDRR